MNENYSDSKYKAITENIIRIFYKVYNELGYGFLEKVYENAMIHEFQKDNIPVFPQHPINVIYDGIKVGEYFADILVDDKIIVEIKAAKALG